MSVTIIRQPIHCFTDFKFHNTGTVFEKMAAYNYVSRSLVEQGQTAERVSGLAGTADFLPLFGVDGH